MAPSKTFIIIFILNINRCFFIFSGNGRYEDPLSGLYLVTSILCLSTDLITHSLPSAIQSLILLRSSLPASSMTVTISFSLIISLALHLKSKKISNDQEPTQSDPISCPQNQKGNN